MAAVVVPTVYNCGQMDQNGVWQADVIKALYNLWQALDAICVGIDATKDTYTAIKTALDTAFAGIHTPTGPTT